MLITGDTGAGKEPIATAIHTNPPRSERKAPGRARPLDP
jgi:transcriptional regulator with GAF, ATPase, and Fis domain